MMKLTLLRLSESLLGDFEALKPAILARPDLTPRGKVTLTEILRLALVKGYQVLRDELTREDKDGRNAA
jgi:hypothetical protein